MMSIEGRKYNVFRSNYKPKYGQWPIVKKMLNKFFVLINMSTFCFSLSKKILQLLVLLKFFIFTFYSSLVLLKFLIFTFYSSFKVNSYIEFIFLNKILQNFFKYYKNLYQIFLTKHRLNINFYIFVD